MTLRPIRAPIRAKLAAIVDFPTPPLPVRIISLWENNSFSGFTSISLYEDITVYRPCFAVLIETLQADLQLHCFARPGRDVRAFPAL